MFLFSCPAFLSCTNIITINSPPAESRRETAEEPRPTKPARLSVRQFRQRERRRRRRNLARFFLHGVRNRIRYSHPSEAYRSRGTVDLPASFRPNRSDKNATDCYAHSRSSLNESETGVSTCTAQQHSGGEISWNLHEPHCIHFGTSGSIVNTTTTGGVGINSSRPFVVCCWARSRDFFLSYYLSCPILPMMALS